MPADRASGAAVSPGAPGLDPRARILVAVALSVAALLAHVPAALILLVTLLSYVLVAGHRAPITRRVLGVAGIGFIIGFGLNVLSVRTGEELLRLPLLDWPVTVDGVRRALRVGLRLTNLALVSGGLAITTPATVMAEGLGALLGPADRVVGMRIHTLVFQLQLAIRFAGWLGEEAARILSAQELRGLRTQGSLRIRVRALRPLFVPILMGTLHRAERMGLLIAARGYRPGRPRRYLPGRRWRLRDTAMVASAGLALAWIVVGG